MLLLDLHCHSSGISTCCALPYDQVIDQAKTVGLDGIVLTNHYCKAYLNNVCFSDWADRYIKEYYDAKKYGEKVGVKILFGVEVTMEFDNRVHMLIYGITPEQVKEYPYLFDKSLKELYSFCSDNGFVLIQAHPYRNGATVLDARYLDGVEINCHPLYGNTYLEELIKVAKQNGLAVTCGCDYHGDTYRPCGGTFLPDETNDGLALAKYLKNAKQFDLQVQEVNCPLVDKKSIKTR